MSESVSMPSAELPETVELALLVRAIWRALPMLDWSAGQPQQKVQLPSAGEQQDTLGRALAAAAALTLHCARPGSVDRELQLLASELAAVGPSSSAQSVLLDVLRQAIGYALGVGVGRPGAEAVAMLDGVFGNDSVLNRVGDAYAEDRIQAAQSTQGKEGGSWFEEPLWGVPRSLKIRKSLQKMLVSWQQTLTANGLGWMWALYNHWSNGKGLDLERLQQFIHQWYETRLIDRVEAGEGDDGLRSKTSPGEAAVEVPIESAAEAAIEGGIVTASADEPTAVDHLGRKPLVDTLADMLASPEQPLPMTIALLGDWGCGKSSMIRQLRLRLKSFEGDKRKLRYRCAEFNAWEYEHTDNLRAGLAHEVVQGLTAGMSWSERLWLALWNARKQHQWEFYGWVVALLLAGIGLSLGMHFATSADSPNQAGSLGLLGLSAWLGSSAFRNAKQLLAHPLASQLKTYLQLPTYGKHLGEVPVIRQQIASLCSRCLGRQAGMERDMRLLVVVDDLDRCQPECITACLDAVRLVMNLPNVAVMLAIDDRIAFQAVAAHYAGLARDGSRSKEAIARDYLGKIIQLPVNLYDPWEQEVAGFVREQLFQVDLGAENGVGNSGNGQLQAASVGAAVDHDRLASETDVRAVGSLAASAEQPSGPAEPVVVPNVVDEPALASQMRDQPFEQQLFIELANEAGFSNPRKLIRLRNGYRLLKGYTLYRRLAREGRQARLTRPDCERLLLGLFWYEYLYQRELGERRQIELLAWEWFEPLGFDDRAKSDAHDRRRAAPESARAMVARLATCLGEQGWHDSYPALLMTVQMAVLPSAESALLLSAEMAKVEASA